MGDTPRADGRSVTLRPVHVRCRPAATWPTPHSFSAHVKQCHSPCVRVVSAPPQQPPGPAAASARAAALSAGSTHSRSTACASSRRKYRTQGSVSSQQSAWPRTRASLRMTESAERALMLKRSTEMKQGSMCCAAATGSASMPRPRTAAWPGLPMMRVAVALPTTRGLHGAPRGRHCCARHGDKLQTTSQAAVDTARLGTMGVPANQVAAVSTIVREDPEIADMVRRGLVKPASLVYPSYVSSLKRELRQSSAVAVGPDGNQLLNADGEPRYTTSTSRPNTLHRGRIARSRVPVFERTLSGSRGVH